MTRLEQQFDRIETLLHGIVASVADLGDRMGALELRMETLDDRVRKLEIDGGELRGRVYDLPSTWAVVTTVIGGQITLAALLLGALKFAQ